VRLRNFILVGVKLQFIASITHVTIRRKRTAAVHQPEVLRRRIDDPDPVSSFVYL
jgi:hypothetical protein